MRSLVLVAVSAIFSVDAAAQTMRVHGRNGELVRDAEICRFGSGGDNSPLSRFFKSGEVICEPLERARIPEGSWNLFARTSREISKEVALSPQSKSSYDFHLTPAVEMSTRKVFGEIAKDAWPAIYLPRTSVAIPVSGTTFLAPQDEVIAPLLVPAKSERGEGIPRLAKMPFRAGDGTFVEAPPHAIVWFDPKIDMQQRFTIRTNDGVSPDDVLVLGKRVDESTRPMIVFRIRDGGETSITVGGEGLAEVKRIIASRGPSHFEVQPLALQPGVSLAATWSSTLQIDSPPRPPTCEPKSDETTKPGWTLELLRCEGIEEASDERFVNLRECVLEATKLFEERETRGEVKWSAVSPGWKYLRLQRGGFPPVYRKIEVRSGGTNHGHVDYSLFRLFGKVTRGGDAVDGVVVFAFGAAGTDRETGEYEAFLARDPKTNGVEIVDCAQERELGAAQREQIRRRRFVAILDEAPRENQRLDFEIPSNRVELTVVEKSSGLPITGADVRLAVILPKETDAAHFAGRYGQTDAEGRIDVGPVTTNREMMICASHESFDNACAERITSLGVREKRSIRLELERADRIQGRLITASPMQYGSIYFFDFHSRVTERIRIVDGKFVMKQKHPEGSRFVVISGSHPLWMGNAPKLAGDQPMMLQFPESNSSGPFVIEATDPNKTNALFTIRVDGQIVPLRAFNQFMMLRGSSANLANGSRIEFPGVVTTSGKVSVVVAPMTFWGPRSGKEEDIFGAPEANTLPAFEVPASRMVKVVLR